MGTFLQDLKYGVRLLAKSPGFTLVAAGSLALGIGANTTIFTLINAILLNPLPVRAPSELVSVYTTDQRNTGGFNSFLQTSWQNFKDYRDKNEVFQTLFAHQFNIMSLTGGTGDPQQVIGEIVTGDYFSALGVQPMLGRGFLPDEDTTPGAKLVAVLGYGLWQTRFAGDPAFVGKTITLNGQAFTVVGIAPKSFRGTNTIGIPNLWVPMMTYPVTTTGFFKDNFDTRRALMFDVTGRLKPGVTREQAEANLKTIARQLEQEYPNDNGGRNITTVPLAQASVNPALRTIFVAASGLLMTVVGLVLLIACANVANLLLARAAVRQKEIAVRLSLGASRSRLILQLLTEGTLLAILGGVVGWLLAYWAQNLLWSFRPPILPADALDLRPDARVLAFTAIMSLATGVIFGLAPAVQSSRPDLVVELKEKTSAPSGSNRLFGLRNLLVAAQVSLSLIALVGAGLFLRSLQNAQRIDPGFDSDKLLVMSFAPGSQGYDEVHGREYYRLALERARAVPGAESATIATAVPLFGGTFARTVFLEGQDATDRQSGKLVEVNQIGPRYFETLGIRLVRGRDFTDADQPGAPTVVIINETMAKTFWPNQDALGRRFKFFGQDNFQEVVGVAKDSKYNFIGENPIPYIYQPVRQTYSPQATLFVRTARPEALVGTVRREIQQLDANLPLTQVSTLNEVFSQSLWPSRMAASLLAIFAGLSLLLAVIGIYGVMAYAVNQRTRELGIRMALGASRGDVLRLVVGLGFRLAMLGVIVGLTFALIAAKLASAAIGNLLLGVGSMDVVTFVTVPTILAAAALGASYLPALRATRIDPMVALRYE